MNLIILDRDGVINHDSDTFIKSPDEWIPIEGSLKAIANLNKADWKVAIATNQSGLARGLFNEQSLNAIHNKMQTALATFNGHIDYITWCPHGPEENCCCRKPKPGLYDEVARHFGCSLKEIPVVGDSMRDLEAAEAVGANPILVKTGKGDKTLRTQTLPKGTIIFENLDAVVSALLKCPSQ
jgi:D-glycero-D-manno-heptose 1,7-bisphosphate phosphatase